MARTFNASGKALLQVEMPCVLPLMLTPVYLIIILYTVLYEDVVKEEDNSLVIVFTQSITAQSSTKYSEYLSTAPNYLDLMLAAFISSRRAWLSLCIRTEISRSGEVLLHAWAENRRVIQTSPNPSDLIDFEDKMPETAPAGISACPGTFVPVYTHRY